MESLHIGQMQHFFLGEIIHIGSNHVVQLKGEVHKHHHTSL